MADPFDRLLERTMKAGANAPEACPSAEVLAAYVDGVLSLPERHAIERHAADCHTCAEHLALLSSLEPVSSGDGAAVKASWWRTWTWLVPVAASVLVAGVWLSLPREAQVPTAEVDRIASAERSVPAPQTPTAVPVGAAPAAPPQTINETAPAPLAVGGAAPKLRKQNVPSTTAAAPREARAADAPAGERHDQPVPPPPPTPTPPALQAAAGPAADSAALTPQSDDLKDKADRGTGSEEQRQRAEAGNIAAPEAVTPATSTVAASAGASSVARRAQSQSSGVLAKTEGKKELASVSQTVQAGDTSGTRWRIEGHAVERSTDGGTTWHETDAPALRGAAFLSAPTADVCWVAAPSGEVVRRTADGKWTRSRVPAPAITGLTASSAVDAIVTTADKRRFETNDGGLTWVVLAK